MAAHIFSDFSHIAREYYSGKTFVAFDTETTGLKSSEDFLIEIGAVKFNYRGTIGKEFKMLINPPVKISPLITEITNIKQEMLENCPGPEKAVKNFLTYIEGEKTILVAHNAPFDVAFINAELERINFPKLKNIAIDSLPFARWTYPEFQKEEGKGHYKLQALASRFKIHVEAAHRAHDDARVCKELFEKMIKDSMKRQKNPYEYQQANLFEENGQLNLF